MKSISADNIIIASRRPPINQIFLPYTFDVTHDSQSSPRFYTLNLNSGVESIRNVLSEVRPTHIFNFSSLCMVGQSWKSPCDWYQTNLVGQAALLEAIAQTSSIEKYIHFSTPEVYGSVSTPTTENWNFKPSTPYAVSRAAGDLALKVWYDAYKIPTVVTRASSIYCEGQHLYRIIPKSLLCGLSDIPLSLEGDGSSQRQFLHMEDVSCALLLLANLQLNNLESFHIASSEHISIRNLVSQCLEIYGKTIETANVKHAPERSGLDLHYNLNDFKIRSLGWTQSVTLSEGLKRVSRWLESNIHSISPDMMSYKHSK